MKRAFGILSFVLVLLAMAAAQDDGSDAPEAAPVPTVPNTAGDEANPPRHCLDQYWLSGETTDSFGCLSSKLACVDIGVSGQTVSAGDQNTAITDQDYYNLVHNAITQGGGTFSAFGINFQTDNIPADQVSAIDNVLSSRQVKFVKTEEEKRQGCDNGGCLPFITHKNTVPRVVTIRLYPVGPFVSTDGQAVNTGAAGGDRCEMGTILPTDPVSITGPTNTLTIQASSTASSDKSLCGVIGIVGAVGSAVSESGIPGIVAAVGSVICNAA